MIQDIIVLTIVFGAFLYAVISIVKTLRTKDEGGCGANCSCGAKSDLKKMILKNKIDPNAHIRSIK